METDECKTIATQWGVDEGMIDTSSINAATS